ncbi:MAG: type IV secretory system conjugative DNA transfer family protein, partial [Actinomycetota bacterium]|nr:type IV secretory system conjugative DNA transfer family protein [Actinomycetota bacterium]
MPAEVLPLAAVALAAALFFQAEERPGPGQPGGGARWARRRDLGALRARRRTEPGGGRGWGGRGASRPAGRLALGYQGRRLLRAEERHALVAFGPPQSGKSAGLAIPALLEWQGPAVASSIKTDLLGTTLERRRALGEVFIFDPFELAGVPGHTWSPLRGAGSWDGALEVAWRLAAAGELDQRGVEGGDFWAVAAEQRLAPLLYAAACTGAGIEQVVAWAYGQGTDTLEAALDSLLAQAGGGQRQHDARAAYEAVRAFEAQADRTRTS